jgi:hypothetical protein
VLAAIRLQAVIEEAAAVSEPPSSDTCCQRLHWRARVLWTPPVHKAFAIVCGVMSLGLVWSEVTLYSPVNLSPFAILIDESYANHAVFGQFVAIVSFGYLSVCAYFALFRMRLSKYYHMHANRKTSENSLLFNASYLLRLFAPLGYNFLAMLRVPSDVIPETAFQRVIGKMRVIPFLGRQFNVVFPVLILLFCVATLFNVYGRILKLLGMPQFEYRSTYQDDLLDEGIALLKSEKRRRARLRDASSSPASSSGGGTTRREGKSSMLATAVPHSDDMTDDDLIDTSIEIVTGLDYDSSDDDDNNNGGGGHGSLITLNAAQFFDDD